MFFFSETQLQSQSPIAAFAKRTVGPLPLHAVLTAFGRVPGSAQPGMVIAQAWVVPMGRHRMSYQENHITTKKQKTIRCPKTDSHASITRALNALEFIQGNILIPSWGSCM
jgi:hypothetical protein